MDWMFVVVQLIVAGWLAFTAIKGTGRLFHTPYVKKGMEEKYKKFGRIGVGAIAALLFVVSGLSIALNLYAAPVNTYIEQNGITQEMLMEQGIGILPPEILSSYNIAYSISDITPIVSVILLTVLVAVFVMMNRMQDKQKKQIGQAKHTAPRAAFYFDEDDGKRS